MQIVAFLASFSTPNMEIGHFKNVQNGKVPYRVCQKKRQSDTDFGPPMHNLEALPCDFFSEL